MMNNQCKITQGFAKNYNPSYKEGGLLGHTGIDSVCGYGSPIYADHDMLIYKVLSNPEYFTAVFGIVDNGVELFEYMIGHCSKIVVEEGEVVRKGQLIAYEGNTGTVYTGNELITNAMRAAGDRRGSHRHSQKRPIKRVKRTTSGRFYLTLRNGHLYRDNEEFYYEAWNNTNGFNGCIDPNEKRFQVDLRIGNESYDVYCLHRLLAQEGVFPHTPTGSFGPLTFAAVRRFQKKYNLPSTGFVGPMTRTVLNKLYNQNA